LNFLRSSIAGFGSDIDFNSIAEHIGFEIGLKETRKK
jgi:hypothetical protein